MQDAVFVRLQAQVVRIQLFRNALRVDVAQKLPARCQTAGSPPVLGVRRQALLPTLLNRYDACQRALGGAKGRYRSCST